MADIITLDDLPATVRSAELVDVLVAGANAKASRVAPCLSDSPTDEQRAEARLVLIGAIKRWTEAGAGSLSAQTAGPFGMTVDTRQRAGYNLWPSEIQALQAICSTGPVGRQAFCIDTAPAAISAHLPWCSLNFDGTCSCGADIAGEPIYELG